MREIRSSGSAEGVMGNCDPYSDLPNLWSSINHRVYSGQGADIVMESSEIGPDPILW